MKEEGREPWQETVLLYWKSESNLAQEGQKVDFMYS